MKKPVVWPTMKKWPAGMRWTGRKAHIKKDGKKGGRKGGKKDGRKDGRKAYTALPKISCGKICLTKTLLTLPACPLKK
jgi:hypothetical protein